MFRSSKTYSGVPLPFLYPTYSFLSLISIHSLIRSIMILQSSFPTTESKVIPVKFLHSLRFPFFTSFIMSPFILWHLYLTVFKICLGLLLVWMFYSEGYTTFKKASRTGIRHGTLDIVIGEVLWSILRGSYKTICSSPLTNAKWHSVAWPNTMTTLHRSDFIPIRDLYTELGLLLNHYKRVPQSIFDWCGMPTGDAYSSGHLFRSHLGLAYVLLVETNSFPNLSLFPGLCSSNLPRYFLDFASNYLVLSFPSL